MAIIVLFTFAVPGVAKADTLYVGPGLEYGTIQSAVNASADGDTIYVHGGVYPEAVVVDKQLILIGVPTGGVDRPIITGWASNTTPGMLIINDNVTVDGFDFDGTGNHSEGVYLRGGLVHAGGAPQRIADLSEVYGYWLEPGTNCTLRNLSVRGFERGMMVSDYCNWSLTGSTFSGNGMGFGLTDVYNATISRCEFNCGHSDDSSPGMIDTTGKAVFYQNNFVDYRYNAIWVSPHAGQNMGNSTAPRDYIYRSKRYVEYVGNYWSNYTGKDENGDGIGDTPYVIDTIQSCLEGGGSYDYTDDHPAMGRWSFEGGTAAIGNPTVVPGDSADAPLNVRLHTLHVGEGQLYSTIQRAINNSADGDTIYVHGGVYPEAVVVDKQLTLIGVPNSSGGMPIIAGWASNTTPGMLIINDNVTVDGFEFDGANIHRYGVYLRGGLVHVSGPPQRIADLSDVHDYWLEPGTNCTLRNISTSAFETGMAIWEYGNVTIADSASSGNGLGIELYFTSNVTVRRCTFTSDTASMKGDASWGIEIFQNNFLESDNPAIWLGPHTSEITGNSSVPVAYMYRSKPSVNRTGNYWDNYTSVDADSDGIADTPYLIATVPSCLAGGKSTSYFDDYPALGRWSFTNRTATIGEPKPGTVLTPTATARPSPTATPAGSDHEALLAVGGLLAMAAACELSSFYRSPGKRK